jgi:hypothetical protein
MTASRSTPPLTPTVQLAASRYIKWRGREMPRGAGFLRNTRAITCPAGHRITANGKLERGLLFCDHREHQGAPQCGWTVYFFVIPAEGGRSRIFVADCTREEHDTMSRLQLDADGILEYFGLSFTRRSA